MQALEIVRPFDFSCSRQQDIIITKFKSVVLTVKLARMPAAKLGQEEMEGFEEEEEEEDLPIPMSKKKV